MRQIVADLAPDALPAALGLHCLPFLLRLGVPLRFGAALGPDRLLIEIGEVVDRAVMLIPADIFAAVGRPRRIDRALPLRPEELAGVVGRLDQLLALAR